MSQTNLFGDQAPPEPEEGTAAGTLPVLVAAPVGRAYDYAAPVGVELRPGDYVLVPFGGRQVPGVVRTRADGEGGAPPKKIRAALKKYDLPPMPPVHLAFLDWVAAYTMTPPGAVLKMALSVPAALEPPDGVTAYRVAGLTPLPTSPLDRGEGDSAVSPLPCKGEGSRRGVKAARQKRTSARARQDWITTRDRARDLRKDMTAAEETLWRHLRGKAMDGARFRKQYPVPPYIADFACPERGVIVEVDGSQHGAQADYDAERTAFLERAGYRVLRVWNNDITGNIEGVLEAIWLAVREGFAAVSDPPPSGWLNPPPDLPPWQGGGEEAQGGGEEAQGGGKSPGESSPLLRGEVSRESKTEVGKGLDIDTPTLSPARRKVLEVMADGRARRAAEIAELAGCGAGVVRGMAEKGLLESVALHAPAPCAAPDPERHGPSLSPDQQGAADTLKGYLKSGVYHASLLDGVTGAGKTEVYFEAVAECIRTGRQALILLPEIALSNAFLDRFRTRFGCAPALWHSQLTPAQRRDTWRAVAEGKTKVVVGARSALFLPYAALGLIVVDEEHDPAYKQEEGAIYHARDMAIVRANMGKIPIVLVSATPSLETMQNVRDGRYALLHLPDRFGGASLPDIKIVDLRKDKPSRQSFISPVLKVAVEETLKAGEQALLFLNRRGYAPLTLCRSCGHRMECPRCTAWLVEHRSDHSLRCHHCGYGMPVPGACPSCNDTDSFAACGPGVERIREETEALFPEARISVLASDTAEGPEQLRAMLADIREHKVDIVIGTQIIAKGHHFPGLTCVGVIDADLGLAGGDLRATERTYQMLHQVAGRAGREAKKGTVYLQTWNPDSRVMQALAAGDRDRFLEAEACEREAARMPPFTRLAGIIVSGRNEGQTIETARELGRTAPHGPGIETLGPAPAPLARLRGKFRYRLLVVADKNLNLQKALAHWLAQVKIPSAVRVQVDIDPQSFL